LFIGELIVKLIDKIVIWYLSLFRNPVKETSRNSENNDIKIIMLKARAAMISPSFRGLYFFQQDFLPKKFYHLGNEMINLVKSNQFFQLVDEFNKGENRTSLNEQNTKLYIHSYSNNKVIIHLHTPDLRRIKFVERETPLCHSIFLCFNLTNSEINYYYTAERSEDFEGYNYVLCGRTKDDAHFNFGTKSRITGKQFLIDIPLEEIELKFGAIK